MSKYIYETKRVNSSRKIKFCDACCKQINIGEPSITIIYHIGDGFENDHVCSDECKEEYIKNFDNPKDDE
jgi:hypothetical protein